MGRWRSHCSLWGSGRSFLHMCMEGWKDGGVEGWKDGRVLGCRGGELEGWRFGGVERWKAATHPCSQRTSCQGHPIVSCPITLPSHHSNPKIHVSQPYWPKTFPIPYLPQPASVPSKRTHLSCCRSPPSPAHFPFFPQAEQMLNGLGQEGRGRHGAGLKTDTQLYDCTLKNANFPAPDINRDVIRAGH